MVSKLLLFFILLHLAFPYLSSTLINQSNPILSQTLFNLFPEIAKVNQAGITECYDEILNGKRIPLFSDNVTYINITGYYYSALPDHTPSNASIKNLLKSIQVIVTYVVNCSLEYEQNPAAEFGIHTKIGLTSLSDMSHLGIEHLTGSDVDLQKVQNAFKSRPNGRSHPSVHVSPSGKGLGGCKKLARSFEKSKLPKQWDWRKFGVVTGVRNQISCGSCWAFNTALAVEAALLKAKKPRNWGDHLSVQQIIDYDSESFGCEGGSAPTAFEYVKSAGLTDEKSYPYLNRKNLPHTRPRNFQIKAKISNYCIRGSIHMPRAAQELLSDEDIMSELVNNGPMYALIYGEGPILQNYKSGIVDVANCPKATNHAVLLVGYTERAWILQNTWGTSWGEGGYFRLAKGKNMCGINTEIAYAIV